MSITDELREWADEHKGWSLFDMQLTAIADRIDAAHDDEVLSTRNLAYNKGFDAGFASADDWYVAHEDELTDHGWVRLPLDADGVPIRVGDVMETMIRGFEGLHAPVEYLALTEDGWEVDGEPATSMRHHHAPTVEDVLREMCLEIDRLCERGGINYDELFAEYAAKLQLKEGTDG